MKRYIWDTGAISLFFMDHTKIKNYMREIVENKAMGYVPIIILSEFYYKTWQKFGQQAAQIRTITISDIMGEIVLEAEDKFEVGELKIKNPELSMVDTIILTLSRKYGATLLTTDTPLSKVKGYSTIKVKY